MVLARRRGLPYVGGIAAELTGAVLVIGAVGAAASLSGLAPRNWLVVLFQINAGLGALPADPLRVPNAIDFGILVLAGVTFLGLWSTLAHRVWMGVAVVLPFAGIGVLLATGLAGRSSLMAAGLVVAALMLTKPSFRPLAYLGLAANALLLVADFATTGSRAPVIAGSVALGYVLLIAWFVLIGVRLLRSGR